MQITYDDYIQFSRFENHYHYINTVLNDILFRRNEESTFLVELNLEPDYSDLSEEIYKINYCVIAVSNFIKKFHSTFLEYFRSEQYSLKTNIFEIQKILDAMLKRLTYYKNNFNALKDKYSEFDHCIYALDEYSLSLLDLLHDSYTTIEMATYRETFNYKKFAFIEYLKQ